ncbi:MAG: hypothetical protein AAF772_14760, partial [Acidobacteriota bacterium]
AVAPAARALAAAPALLAAPDWPSGLRRAAAEALEDRVALGQGWRAALMRRLAALEAIDAQQPASDARRTLVLRWDAPDGAPSSVYLFRRHAWPVALDAIDLDAARVDEALMIPAVDVRRVDPALFADGCALGGPLRDPAPSAADAAAQGS